MIREFLYITAGGIIVSAGGAVMITQDGLAKAFGIPLVVAGVILVHYAQESDNKHEIVRGDSQ